MLKKSTFFIQFWGTISTFGRTNLKVAYAHFENKWGSLK